MLGQVIEKGTKSGGTPTGEQPSERYQVLYDERRMTGITTYEVIVAASNEADVRRHFSHDRNVRVKPYTGDKQTDITL